LDGLTTAINLIGGDRWNANSFCFFKPLFEVVIPEVQAQGELPDPGLLRRIDKVQTVSVT
jgi:hypothetical protein